MSSVKLLYSFQKFVISTQTITSQGMCRSGIEFYNLSYHACAIPSQPPM